MRTWSLAVLHVVVATVLLMVPATINRSPFVFYDTAHYLLLGQSVLKIAVHHAEAPPGSPPIGPQAKPPSSAPVPPVSAPASASPRGGSRGFMLTYVGGRSVYYSLILAAAVGLGGLWFAASLQSLAGAWLCWMVRSALPGFTVPQFYGLVAVLAAFSSLPYFATYLMPDVFAGYVVLSLALLATISGFGPRIALWLMTVFCVAAHATNLPVAVIAATGALVTRRLVSGRWRGGQPTWIVSAVVAGALGSSIFALATSAVFGDVPHSPPYLTARVLADGPGRVYLASHCGRRPAFAICAFRDRPLTDNNEILWSTDPRRGVFYFADYDLRVRLSEEQTAFALRSIGYSPSLSFRVMSNNVLSQIATLTIGGEIGATRDSWLTMLHFVIPESGEQLSSSLSYRGAFPFSLVDRLIAVSLLVCVALITMRLIGKDIRRSVASDGADDRMPKVLVGCAVTTGTIILVNAVICGMLSGPTYRYQGRLTWLIVVLAFIVVRYAGTGWHRSKIEGYSAR